MKIQSHLPALLLCAASANAADNIRIEYMPAETTHDKLAEQSIQSSDVNPIFVRLSQAYFPFRKPLTLIYGGEDGPMYDPDTHTIHIPYTFYLESLNYFSNNQYEDRYGKSPKTGALDTLLHTLLHEAWACVHRGSKHPCVGERRRCR